MKLDFKVSTDAAGQRLDKFLRRRLENLPLSHLYKLVRTKKVRVNGARAEVAQLLQPGDEITVHVLQAGQPPPPKPPEAIRQDFKVLYEDEHILAVDKPSGLRSIPGPASPGEKRSSTRSGHTWRAKGVQTPEGEFKPSPAHRLDRETSGVVVVAKNRQAMVRLTEMFTAGEADKTYLALAKGRFQRESGSIDLRLAEHQQTYASKQQRGVNLQGGAHPLEEARRRTGSDAARVTIETGRTHQIRRHLQGDRPSGGGDTKYGDFPFNRIAQRQWGVRRMFLHSARLELAHPLTKKRLIFESPLPQELADCLPRAGIDGKHRRPETGFSGRPAICNLPG